MSKDRIHSKSGNTSNIKRKINNFFRNIGLLKNVGEKAKTRSVESKSAPRPLFKNSCPQSEHLPIGQSPSWFTNSRRNVTQSFKNAIAKLKGSNKKQTIPTSSTEENKASNEATSNPYSPNIVLTEKINWTQASTPAIKSGPAHTQLQNPKLGTHRDNKNEQEVGFPLGKAFMESTHLEQLSEIQPLITKESPALEQTENHSLTSNSASPVHNPEELITSEPTTTQNIPATSIPENPTTPINNPTPTLQPLPTAPLANLSKTEIEKKSSNELKELLQEPIKLDTMTQVGVIRQLFKLASSENNEIAKSAWQTFEEILEENPSTSTDKQTIYSQKTRNELIYSISQWNRNDIDTFIKRAIDPMVLPYTLTVLPKILKNNPTFITHTLWSLDTIEQPTKGKISLLHAIGKNTSNPKFNDQVTDKLCQYSLMASTNLETEEAKDLASRFIRQIMENEDSKYSPEIRDATLLKLLDYLDNSTIADLREKIQSMSPSPIISKTIMDPIIKQSEMMTSPRKDEYQQKQALNFFYAFLEAASKI